MNYIKTKIKTNPRRAVWNSPPDEAAPQEPPPLSIRRPRPADTSSLHTGIAMLTSTAAAAPDSLEFQAVWDNINHGKALRPTNNKATQINSIHIVCGTFCVHCCSHVSCCTSVSHFVFPQICLMLGSEPQAMMISFTQFVCFTCTQ